jgi:hypothetical protein
MEKEEYVKLLQFMNNDRRLNDLLGRSLHTYEKEKVTRAVLHKLPSNALWYYTFDIIGSIIDSFI